MAAAHRTALNAPWGGRIVRYTPRELNEPTHVAFGAVGGPGARQTSGQQTPLQKNTGTYRNTISVSYGMQCLLNSSNIREVVQLLCYNQKVTLASVVFCHQSKCFFCAVLQSPGKNDKRGSPRQSLGKKDKRNGQRQFKRRRRPCAKRYLARLGASPAALFFLNASIKELNRRRQAFASAVHSRSVAQRSVATSDHAVSVSPCGAAQGSCFIASVRSSTSARGLNRNAFFLRRSAG